ncbi:MAG TPA: VIT domain-containing protein, partial [Kofleriaceae bacterium]
ARNPNLGVHPQGGEEYPLPIARLGVDVVVEDQVARVALDQTFHNDQPQTLEGMYRFAIPPDAALQRLAMYVDGRLVESGVVERMAARRIYEELVYRRVDPALLEWAGTGRLALRVYPIPARQDKRLMIAYTQSLPSLYQDYTLAIPLPEVDGPVGALDIAVRVKDCAGCELSSTSHAIRVTRDGNDAVVHYQRAGEAIGDSFVLRVRDPRHAVTVSAARRGDDQYVMVRAPAELAGQPVAYRPRTWVILDDVSASRGKLELQAQTDVIDGLLHELDERDRVAVVAFDVEARTKLGLTQVIDVDRRAVRKALAGEGGIGATDLGRGLDAALPLLANVGPDSASIIYVGDGVITSGARNLDALRARLVGQAHFIGVGVGDAPDTQTLQGLAGATAGYATTIDLADDVGWRTFDLVSALHTQRVTGLTAQLVDAQGRALEAAAYLAQPQLADGEQLELVAKTRAMPAAVELGGTLAGQPWHKRIELGSVRSADAGYLPRLWAQRHIAARLLAKHEPVAAPACDPKARRACPSEADARAARDEQIRREVIALGKQYFLLSRHTSLLVLEDDAMYARYGVAKGSGETWAPYAMPARIPVSTAPAPVITASTTGELVRPPMQVFYGLDPGGPSRERLELIEDKAKA